jgi:transposase
LGLDETLFCRQGRWRRQEFCTSIVDVSPDHHAQLLDVVPGRSAAGPSAWLQARPTGWRQQIRWGVLDLSGPYRKTFDDTLPEAVQVADPLRGIPRNGSYEEAGIMASAGIGSWHGGLGGCGGDT